MSAAPQKENRILVLSPLQRDLLMAGDILSRAGFHCEGFRDAAGFRRSIDADGAGMLLVAAEALFREEAVSLLTELLHNQPAWSDLPVSIITHARITDPKELRAVRRLEHLHSVTFLDRPVKIAALVSSARAALQARTRQYQVRDLLAAAEEDVRQRDEFLAMLSHELRNPLSAITNAVNVIKLNPEGGAQVNALLDRQVGHLSRMVDDLLDVARITSGKVELQRRRLDLASVVKGAVETIAAEVADKRHALEVDCQAGRVFVDGDHARLLQVVTNLLHNAVKYTEPGGRIVLRLEQADGEAVLRVCDSGIGLDGPSQERIFELFAQGSRDIARSQGGLGIGLTIVRRLVRMHGGDIEVSSDGPGKGSEFRVRLPLSGGAVEMGKTVAVARQESSRRVLVVDDNRGVADGLAMLVEALGHEVRTVYRGEDALKYADHYQPDVVFLDLGMPGMDGFAVAESLHRLPRRAAMTVVAVTGYGDGATVDKARRSGFDHHLLKPASLDAMMDILAAAPNLRMRATS